MTEQEFELLQYYRQQQQDPVHCADDGTWWFWDETWSYPHGPFDTESHARKSMWFYCRDHLGVDYTGSMK